MGTRSIIVMTGKGALSPHCTIRLYRHWDGGPEFNLADIASGIRMARRIFEKSFKKRHDPTLTEVDIPAECMAACIIAATIDWHGSAAEMDTQEEENIALGGKRTRDCIWHEAMERDHFGNQGDLEWVYVVDIPKTTVTVYGEGYGTPKQHLRTGPADPLSCLDAIREECQAKHRRFLKRVLRKFATTGWTLTPPAVPYQSAVRRAVS